MKAAFEGYSFKFSENVTRTKVYLRNRYGIELAGDPYVPRGAKDGLATIAVCGLFGAVREQTLGLYADEMASRGFVALALNPSPIGEGREETKNAAPPDISTEGFSATVDVLSNMDMVDPERIDAIGIYGLGGMALNTTIINTHIKVTITSIMYDVIRVNAKDYFDQDDSAQTRCEMKKILSAQRMEGFKSGVFARARDVADPLPSDALFFVKDYYDYYRMKRRYAERSLNSNEGWNETSSLFFINMPTLQYSEEIRSAVLMVHGEKAHSCYFSRDTFSKLTGGNEEPLILPDTAHTDLYDRKDKVLLHKIESSFTGDLCQGRSQ